MALVGVFFVDGYVLRGAVDLAGGGDEHAARAQLPRGVEHVERTLDVGVDVAVGAVVGERDRDERRQVEHPFLPAHGGAHAVGVAHVAHKDVDLVFDLGRQGVDPPQRAEGIVQAERADFFAALDEFFRQMAADKAVGAGDHYGMCHGMLLYKRAAARGYDTITKQYNRFWQVFQPCGPENCPAGPKHRKSAAAARRFSVSETCFLKSQRCGGGQAPALQCGATPMQTAGRQRYNRKRSYAANGRLDADRPVAPFGLSPQTISTFSMTTGVRGLSFQSVATAAISSTTSRPLTTWPNAA